jgi:hypothetical protein
MRRRGHLDALAAGAILAAVVVALGIAPAPVRFALALPLLLGVPGYAVTRAAFAGRALDAAQLILLSVGLSVALAALLALVLDITLGLRPAAWAIALAGVTVGASAVAAARRRDLEPRRPRPAVRVRGRDALLLGAAGVVACGAVVLARTPLSAKDVEGYTALWIVDAGASDAGIRVGVTSGELNPVTFRLLVTSGGKRLYEARRLDIRPGTNVERVVPLDGAAGGTVEALLFAVGSNRAFRRATLQISR